MSTAADYAHTCSENVQCPQRQAHPGVDGGVLTSKQVYHLPESTTAAARPRFNWFPRYQNILRISDGLMISATLVAAMLWLFGQDSFMQVAGLPISYPVASLVIGAVWWIALGARRSRDRGVVGHGLEEYRRTMSAGLYTLGTVAVLAYSLQAELSRAYFLLLLPIGTLFLLAGRRVCRHSLHRRRAIGEAHTPTIVVGSLPEVANVVRDLRRNPNAGYRPVGIAASLADADAHVLNEAPLAGLPRCELATLNGFVQAHGVGAVVVVPGLSSAAIREMAWHLEASPVELLFVPSLADVAGPRLTVDEMQGLSFVRVELPRFSGWSYTLKRGFDIVFSSLALLLVAPVLLIIAMLIKFEDGGPVVFRQERIGAGGKPFVIHKFRTMIVNAEERVDAMIAASGGSALLFKMADDPRVTRIGKILRKYSLDELPQFWTVLRGDMSVVGPRPQVAREVAEYTSDHHRRLLIKPGITGLWQVSGRSTLSVEDSIRLDLRYVENWSLVGDVAIILRTIKTLLRPEGAK